MAFELFFISTKVEYKKDILGFCNDYIAGLIAHELKTSGSTGIPKKILFTKLQLQNSAKATIKKLNLNANQSAFICLNTNYIAGKMMLVRCIEAQMKATIVEPSSFPFDDLDNDNSFDFAAFVPLQLKQIFERNRGKDIDRLNGIKIIIIGGGPIDLELEQKLKHLKSEVYHTFGMTETLSHFALRDLKDNNKGYYELLENVDIALGPDQCLKVKSDVTNNEWIQTNDIVELISENNRPIGFKWIGRSDNVINSGGIKINIEILEKLIEETFQRLKINKRFFIYKQKEAKLGEIAVLYIEGEKTTDWELNLILENIKNQVENKYWTPKKIQFVEIFLETPSGKLDRIKTVNLETFKLDSL